MKIPVMAFKSKSKENRFLAANIDVGDWSDPDLDVLLDNIENASLIWRKDLTKPTDKDLNKLKELSAEHKKHMIEKFGDNAMISFDVEEWLKHYDPVHLEITRKQFNHAKEIAEM
jgi:hypothetical protein